MDHVGVQVEPVGLTTTIIFELLLFSADFEAERECPCKSSGDL